MADAAEIKADIDRTRADLADTVGALAEKLDPKEQARKRAHEARIRVHARYVQTRDSAPPQVRQALGAIEQAAAPVVARARCDPRRSGLVVGGLVLALFVIGRAQRR